MQEPEPSIASSPLSLQSTPVLELDFVPPSIAESMVARSAQINYDENETKPLLEVVQGMKIPKHSKDYWLEVARILNG